MKKISELTDFYYKTLYPTLEELENDRKHLRYRIIVIGVMITFITLLIAISMKDVIAQNFDLLFFFRGCIYRDWCCYL